VPSVSIIIVTFQSERWISACLDSVSTQSFHDYEVIIVDNCSTDRTVELVTAGPLLSRIVKMDSNRGFGAAVNRGVQIAKGRLLLFLNPDAKLHREALRHLVASHEASPGIIACAQYSYDGTRYRTACNTVDIFGYPLGEIRGKCFYADGAALMMSRRDFDAVGGFDEDLFMFHEEVDLCWRGHQMGIRVRPCDEAVVYHESGGTAEGGAAKAIPYVTTSFRRFHGEKNILRNILKNYSLPLLALIVPLYVAQICLEMLLMLALRSPRGAAADLAALWWNVKNLGGTLRLRSAIQNRRRSPDRAVMRHMVFTWAKLVFIRRLGFPVIR
jgi:GT2 family glycosyltransferase